MRTERERFWSSAALIAVAIVFIAVLFLSRAEAATIPVACDPVEHTAPVYYYFIGVPDPQSEPAADVPHKNCVDTVIQVRAILVGVDPQDCLPDEANDQCSGWSDTLTIKQPNMTAIGLDPATADRAVGSQYMVIEALNVPEHVKLVTGTEGQEGYWNMKFTIDEVDCHGIIGTLNLAPETQIGETVALTLVDEVREIEVQAGLVMVIGAEPSVIPTPQNLRVVP